MLTLLPLMMKNLDAFDQAMASLDKLKCLIFLGCNEEAFASVPSTVSLIRMNLAEKEFISSSLELYAGLVVTIETMIETDGAEKLIELLDCLLKVVHCYFVGPHRLNMAGYIGCMLTKIMTRLWWQSETEKIRAYYGIMDRLLNTIMSSTGSHSIFISITTVSAIQRLSDFYMKAKDWRRVCDVNKLSQNVMAKEFGSDAELSFLFGDCYSNIAIAYTKLQLYEESEIAQKNAIFTYKNARDWRDHQQMKIILGKTAFNLYHLEERRFTEDWERNIRKLSTEWNPSSDTGASFRPVMMGKLSQLPG